MITRRMINNDNLTEFGLQTAVIFAHQREVKAVRKRSWRRATCRHLAVQKIRSKYKENKKKPLLGTSLGGSAYARTASKSVIRPIFADSTALFPPRDVFVQTVLHFGHTGWKKCCTVVEFAVRETYFCVDRV